MIRLLIAAMTLVLLTGCVTLGDGLTNRITMPLAMDECRVDSRWYLPGLSTPLDERDCKVIREAMMLRALEEYMRTQQAKQ